jgi:hypothetical protein
LSFRTSVLELASSCNLVKIKRDGEREIVGRQAWQLQAHFQVRNVVVERWTRGQFDVGRPNFSWENHGLTQTSGFPTTRLLNLLFVRGDLRKIVGKSRTCVAAPGRANAILPHTSWCCCFPVLNELSLKLASLVSLVLTNSCYWQVSTSTARARVFRKPLSKRRMRNFGSHPSWF